MNKSPLALFLFCFLFFSCDNQPIVYNKFETIEKGLWEKQKELVFSFEIEDITFPYHILLEIRNNNFYPFQDLWLNRIEIQPDSLVFQDTISITLADQYGRWSGNGISLFETEYTLYSGHFFKTPGIYTYTFQHIMYKEPLPGIQNIGLRVEKDQLNSRF